MTTFPFSLPSIFFFLLSTLLLHTSTPSVFDAAKVLSYRARLDGQIHSRKKESLPAPFPPPALQREKEVKIPVRVPDALDLLLNIESASPRESYNGYA